VCVTTPTHKTCDSGSSRRFDVSSKHSCTLYR